MYSAPFVSALSYRVTVISYTYRTVSIIPKEVYFAHREAVLQVFFTAAFFLQLRPQAWDTYSTVRLSLLVLDLVVTRRKLRCAARDVKSTATATTRL